MPAPGIREQRWVVAHAPFITQEYADKLKALGGGVSVLGGWRYISGTAQQNGPPFKLLADSGIPIGMSSDGMQISPMNPWLGLYYVVTGKNARGEVINAGQTLDARRSAAPLHGRERLVPERGKRCSARSSPASTPTSPCYRPTTSTRAPSATRRSSA